MLYGNETFDTMKELYEKIDTSIDLQQFFVELAEFFQSRTGIYFQRNNFSKK